MQAVTAKIRYWLVFVTLVLVASFITGCSYRETMTFYSPSKKRSVSIFQTRIDNSWGARIELRSGGNRFVLHRIPREAILYFVHVAWSPDEGRVAVIGSGFAMFQISADTRTGTALPFESMRATLAASVKKEYRTPDGEDPLAWASSWYGHTAFHQRNPGIRLSYYK